MFIIFSKENCPYCVKAKELLKSKDIPFKVLSLENDFRSKEQFVATAQAMAPAGYKVETVPQIFNNGIHIGGFDNLEDHLAHKVELSELELDL